MTSEEQTIAAEILEVLIEHEIDAKGAKGVLLSVAEGIEAMYESNDEEDGDD